MWFASSMCSALFDRYRLYPRDGSFSMRHAPAPALFPTGCILSLATSGRMDILTAFFYVYVVPAGTCQIYVFDLIELFACNVEEDLRPAAIAPFASCISTYLLLGYSNFRIVCAATRLLRRYEGGVFALIPLNLLDRCSSSSSLSANLPLCVMTPAFSSSEMASAGRSRICRREACRL